MQLIVENNGEELKLEGIIRGIDNKFYAEIEVPNEIKLEHIITNIKGYHSTKGKVTLMNSVRKSARASNNTLNASIYVYDAEYIVSGYINEKDISIKSMTIYFKELDYFFVEDSYEIVNEKMETEFTITQKYNSEILLDDENITIRYNRTAGLDYDLAGHILFLNPAKIDILFKKEINLIQIFEEISKIERVLGFAFNKKMNLIETMIYDEKGELHELIAKFQKNYGDVILEEFFNVDLNSKLLLKDVLKKYYSDKRIAGAINMFYEYIYNELDEIFEFTSLVNTLELILSDDKYKNEIEQYAIQNNENLIRNNKKMNKIFELLSAEDKGFIKQFYRFNNVELRDKIKYVCYNLFELTQSEKSDRYISAVINTRNYFVHGGEKSSILNSVDIVETKYLLKMILYILIVRICTNEENPNVDTYNLAIPTIYDTVVKLFE